MDVVELRRRQKLPLKEKIPITLEKIKNWYEYWEGNVYVAFSGGKDSRVMWDMIEGLYPDVRKVFFDTGLEFPEIRKFVKTFSNVDWVRPKMKFNKIIEKYGYPVISKEIAMAIERFNNTKSQKNKIYRLMGGKKGERSGTISKRWRFLLNAPFKISGNCCNAMKKGPSKSYCNRTKTFPYIGIMATNSRLREQNYLRHGCNMIDLKFPHSWPMGFWNEEDIWEYIKMKELDYCEIYDMGYDRTGCMYCMFGVHLEPKPNRFQRMAITHPKHYDFCMRPLEKKGLGLRDILKFMNIPYKPYKQNKMEDFN